MSTFPTSHQDLLVARTAVLATIGPDGRPQVSAVWFLSEGESIRLSLNTARQKVKNLEQRSGCTLFILDPANAQRYLEVRGDAQIDPDPEYAFADQVGTKYGVDLRIHDHSGEERVMVTLLPSRINAIDLSA
jgi:PPOX class probable F420-dependent enzyme